MLSYSDVENFAPHAPHFIVPAITSEGIEPGFNFFLKIKNPDQLAGILKTVYGERLIISVVSSAAASVAATTVATATAFVVAAATAAAEASLLKATFILGLRLSFIDDDFSSLYFCIVQVGQGSLAFAVIFHFNETKSFAAAGFAISYDLN